MPEPPLLYLAPMAGVTNPVFRSICRAEGADVVTSEFVSAEGILRRNARTREFLEFFDDERPFGVQLFGSSPDALAEAARAVAEWVRPDFIDLNFGCPVNKVICREGGSALLKNCSLLASVARAVVDAVAPLPVTAKIRTGWDERTVNAVETARILESCGVRRIAVHGRTRAMGYSGEADWAVIARVVDAVRIPVVGNGDIRCADSALARWRESGVAGLMIGRAAMGAPWIFRQIRAALDGRPVPPDPDIPERWERILSHCSREIVWRKDEKFAMRSMRSRLMALTRGMPGGRRLRESLAHVESLEGLRAISERHLVEQTSPDITCGDD